MKKISIILASVLLASLIVTSCLKKDFDNPPDTSGFDPQLPVNMSIMALRKMKPYSGGFNLDTMLITQDLTISAIVNADDRSGNLYKSIYVQDSTGGIQLSIDGYSLYNNYPVGRKIYIKLKGLYLSYNSGYGTPILSMGISEQAGPIGISGAAISKHIIKASTGNLVKDTVITFDQARTYSAGADESLLCRLVTISDSLQFADTVRDYTSPTDETNRYVLLCGSNQYTGNTAPSGTLAVRSSNYANFHAIKLPRGKGKIRGIYTIFRTTPQLLLRDTADVMFYGPRCGSGGGTPPAPGVFLTIDSVRKIYKGTDVTLGAYRVTGTVITDGANKNVATGNFTIQSGNKGINIYIGSSGTVPILGDSVVIDITGGKVSSYMGMLEIDNISTSDITKIASNVPVTPRTVTIGQLVSNFTTYEATLVKVVNATVAAGGTYSGNKDLTDGTGTIVLRTASTATFATQPVPTTAKSFTGLAGWFGTTKQILIRNPGLDVQ